MFALTQGASATGTWMQRIAQDWLVLELSGGSAICVGFTIALQFLPLLTLTIWGGSLGDRYSKARLLIWTSAGLGTTAVVLGCLQLGHTIALWHVYVAALVTGVLCAIDSPVRQAYTGELVGRSQLGDAVAFNLLMNNIARIVGPALAGVLITTMDSGWTFIANGLSFAVIAAALTRLAASQQCATVSNPATRVRAGEGFRYVWQRTDLRAVLLMVFVASTFGMIFPVSLASLVYDTLGRGADAYGLLCVVLAIGTLVGTSIASLSTRCPSVATVLAAAAAFGAMEVCAGMMSSYLTVALLLFATGALMLGFTKLALTRLHLTVENQFRGRVMGVYTLCTLGGWPIGAALLAWLADTLGPRTPLTVGGSVIAAAALLVAFTLVKPAAAAHDHCAKTPSASHAVV